MVTRLTYPFGVTLGSPDGLFFRVRPGRFRLRQSVAKLRWMPSSWRFCPQFCQDQVGLYLYPCRDALVGVKSSFLPAAMGFGDEDAGSTVALQELFDERDTDAEEISDGARVTWVDEPR